MMFVRKIFRGLQKKFSRRPILPLMKRHRKRISIAATASFGFRSKIMVYPSSQEQSVAGPNVIISDNCHIGNQTEIHTYANSRVWIKSFTSINDNCRILGNVTIERYCLLASNIFISSGAHVAFTNPAMLIKDQDKLFPFPGKPVRIEEDSWIGWGVVIMPGVYVGKGAVIGANAVVTRDVPPYAVVAGSPAVKIRDRLDFAPPQLLSCPDKNTHPYFYRGFALSQAEIAAAAGEGIIRAGGCCCAVLAGTENTRQGVRITGKFPQEVTSAEMLVTVNRTSAAVYKFAGGDFNIFIPVCAETVLPPGDPFGLYDSMGEELKKHTCLCIQITKIEYPAQKQYPWGISLIELVNHENQL